MKKAGLGWGKEKKPKTAIRQCNRKIGRGHSADKEQVWTLWTIWET